MTESDNPQATPPPYGQPPQEPPAFPTAPPPFPAAPPAGYAVAPGQIGTVRSTGICILLYFVTFGIYGLYWWYVTHEEMKRHSGQGLGGIVALLLAIFIGIVMPFITSAEVGELERRRGAAPRVSALTGLWYFPGALILVGPFIWFIKTNGALNDYWKSLGAAA